MNHLEYIKHLQQNLRVAQGYEQILNQEIVQNNNLTWYEKESILNQLEQIKYLIHQSLYSINSLEKSKFEHNDEILENCNFYCRKKTRKPFLL